MTLLILMMIHKLILLNDDADSYTNADYNADIDSEADADADADAEKEAKMLMTRLTASLGFFTLLGHPLWLHTDN